MKGLSVHRDEDLMMEIKAGNMLAFDLLYRKYCSRIYKFSYSLLKSKEEAENLLQEVFLSLWECRFAIEKNASVKSYLFTVTYNTAISYLRKKAKECEFFQYLKSLQEPVDVLVDSELHYRDLEARLEEIINNLPQRQKEIYLMHKVDGLKYSEIAERLHISVNTIENHMARALKTIREKLSSYSLMGLLFFFLFV
ncbi:MAG: RNA polymerase sigma-70 factor [Bacteroidales bacterium]|nr:RNA polymerase sigma-70 factor [Bacteroidales bacterium]